MRQNTVEADGLAGPLIHHETVRLLKSKTDGRDEKSCAFVPVKLKYWSNGLSENKNGAIQLKTCEVIVNGWVLCVLLSHHSSGICIAGSANGRRSFVSQANYVTIFN